MKKKLLLFFAVLVFTTKAFSGCPSSLVITSINNYSYGWVGYSDTAYICGGVYIKPLEYIEGNTTWSNNLTTDSILVNEAGNYRCTFKYYCSSMNDTITNEINFTIIFYNEKLSFGDSIINLPNCSKPYALNPVSGGSMNYKNLIWEPTSFLSDSSITNPTLINYFGTNKYSVKIEGTIGCDTILNLTIKHPFNDPKPFSSAICQVSIDPTNSKNQLIWNKNPIETRIVKYRIYKQSTANSQYELIHEQPYDSLSEFTDVDSKPTQEVARYKLSVVDSCGFESELSEYHTTILLSSNLGINNTVNLNWNEYKGFTYNNFEIWRSLDGKNYNKLSQVANNTYSYIDNNPPSIGFYQIRISNPNNCTIERSASSSYVSSNVVDKNGNGVTSITELNNQNSEMLKIYPNPAQNSISLKVAPALLGSEISIINIAGIELLTSKINQNNQSIDISDLAKGIYFIKESKTQQAIRFVKN